MTSVSDKILRRVRGYGRGKRVFTWKDFYDFGSRSAIDQALSRLVKGGKLRRVARGMYDLPTHSKLLKKPAPASTQSILDAVRRHDSVKAISLDNAAVANALGVTTAVPVQTRYRWTGGRRNIKLGNSTLQLRPAGTKTRDWLGTPAAPIVQALLYGGKHTASDFVRRDFARKYLSTKARKVLSDHNRYKPLWMQHAIDDLLADGNPPRAAQS